MSPAHHALGAGFWSDMRRGYEPTLPETLGEIAFQHRRHEIEEGEIIARLSAYEISEPGLSRYLGVLRERREQRA